MLQKFPMINQNLASYLANRTSNLKLGNALRRIALRSLFLIFLLGGSTLSDAQENDASLDKLYNDGGTAYQKKDLKSAKDIYLNGYETSKRRNLPEYLGKFAEQLSAVCYNEGDLDRAISLELEALESVRSGIRKVSAARIRLRLAQLYGRKQDYESAQFHATQAYLLYSSLNDEAGVAKAKKTQADIDSKLGRYPRAIESLLKAKEVFVRQKNPLQIALVNESLGYAYSRSDQYDRAILSYLDALPVFQETGQTSAQARALDGLGATYQSVNQDEKAKSAFAQALEIRLKSAGLERDLAYSYSNLGVVCDKLGDLESSINYHLKALELRRKSDQTQDIPKSLTNLAAAYLDANRPELALRYQLNSLVEARKQSAPDLTARSLAGLGNIYESLERFPEALASHKEAISLLKGGRGVHELVSHVAMGRIYIAEKRYPEAEIALRKALDLYEGVSKQSLDPTESSDFQENFDNLFNLFSLLLTRTHRVSEALEMSERGRSFGLSRQIALNRNEFLNLLDPTQIKTIEGFSQTLAIAEKSLQSAENEIEPEEKAERDARKSRLERLKLDCNLAESNLNRARERLYASSSDLRLLQGVASPKWTQLQKLADARPDTLFLSWQIYRKSVIGIAFAGGAGAFYFEIPVSSLQLHKMASDWLSALTAPTNPALTPQERKKMERREIETSHALYLALFEHWEKAGLLRKGRFSHLVLRAEGELLRIPFAALFAGENRRLIDSYSVSMLPSFGMLTLARNLRKPVSSLLCIADPCGERARRLVRAGGSAEFGPLPGAKLEGERIAEIIPGSTVLSGAFATEKSVVARMSDYRLLHFATHAWLDAQQPFRSGLALAEPEGESAHEIKQASTVGAGTSASDNGFLDARKILGMRLSAQLTTLSACESGLGESTTGEGMLGLVWAFRAAGCPNVVASQWSVNDSSTWRLMTNFYGSLKKGARIDDALREAMLQQKKVARTKSPFYWAPFQVFGEGGRIDLKVGAK